jgi:dipeptidyl aminopeptidase/acylaminoacyl peptidase
MYALTTCRHFERRIEPGTLGANAQCSPLGRASRVPNGGMLSKQRPFPPWITLSRFICCLTLAILATLPRDALAQDRTRTITARDLATLRDINGLNASPDGRWIAFSITQADPGHNAYDTAWHVLDIATRQTRRIADGGELVPSITGLGMILEYLAPRTSVWSPDSLWFTYLRRDRGSTQIWRVNRNGRHVRQLTHNRADVRAFVYARDGGSILFQTTPSQAQIAQDQLAEGHVGFLYDERFIPVYSPWPVASRDTDLQHVTASTPSQLAAQQVWAYELASGRERLATKREQAEYAALSAPAREGPNVDLSIASPHGVAAWSEARDPERQGIVPPRTIVTQHPGAPSPLVCMAPACTNGDMRGLWWRNDEELLFVRGEGVGLRDHALYAWRPSVAEAPRLIARIPELIEEDARRCVVAQGKLLCLYAQSNYPSRLIAVDLDNGAIETLFDPNPDFVRFDLGPTPRRLAIRAESGADTYGYLVLPPRYREGERLPLVIVTYRCRGFLRGGIGDEYPIYPFAAQHFAVLCFNAPDDLDRMARLDVPSYTNWSRGPGEPMRRRVEDTLDAAVAQLDQMGLIDPDRVSVTGLSYGAEMVGYALPHMPRLAAAIASQGSVGPSDYSTMGRTTRAFHRVRGLGRPDETMERWREMSFSPHVQNVYAPLLINVADHEMVSSLDAVTALEDFGRVVEMYVFPDEYHIKWQPIHRLAIYNRNIDWLNFWLRGVESGLTGDTSQYVRWRSMRAQVATLRQTRPADRSTYGDAAHGQAGR